MIWRQLESDQECGREQQSNLIDIVQETERIVADRDQEIVELRTLLKIQTERSSTLHQQQVTGANAIASLIDADETIAMERHNLAKVKQEWMEKLREAEIELSIERAVIARQQHELQVELQYHRRVNTSS